MHRLLVQIRCRFTRCDYIYLYSFYSYFQGLDIATNKATDAELEGVHQCMVGFVKPEDTSFTVVKVRLFSILFKSEYAVPRSGNWPYSE